MYKITTKYFGELADEISGIDGSKDCAENYELGEKYYCETISILKEKLDELMYIGQNKGFVKDDETSVNISMLGNKLDEENVILRFFFEKQENWNCYYELIIGKCTELEDYTIEYERNNILDKTIQILFTELDKLKQKFLQTQGDSLISEMSLLLETTRSLDNEKYKKGIVLEDLRILETNLKYFVDELVAIYYNSDLGNSYEDIMCIIKEFIREFKEEE